MMNPSTTTTTTPQSQQFPPSAGKLLIEALRSTHDGFFGLHLFSKSLLSKSLGFSFILGPRFQEKKTKEKSEETEEESAEDSPLSFYKNLLSYQDILDINILGLPIALDDVVTSTRLFLESQADSEKVLEFSVRNLVADRRFDGCCFGASSTTISNSKNANDDDQNNKNKNNNNKHQDEDFEREVQQGIALCKTIFHFVVTGKRHRMGLPQNWGESLIRMTRCRIFASITRLLCRGLFLADWQNKIKNHASPFGAAVGSNSSSESIMTKTSSASASSYNFSNTSAPIMTFPLVNIHQIETLLSQERTRLHSASVNFSLSQQELPPNLQNHSLHHPSAAANTSILSSLTSIPSVSQQQLFSSSSSASLQQQQKFFTDLCPEVYASFPPNEDHFLRTTQEGLLHDAMNIFSIDPGVAAVHPWRLDAKMLLASLCLLQEEDDDDENGNRSKMKNKNKKNENFGSLSSFGCGSLTWGNQNEDDEDDESNNQKKKRLRRVGFADIDASALGRVIAHAPLRRKNSSKTNMPTSNDDDDFDYDDQEDQEEHSTLYSGLDALQTFLNIVVSGSSLTHKKCLALMMMMTSENDEEDRAEEKDEYYQKMIRNNPYFRLFSKKMKKSSSSSKHHRQISASIFPKSSSSYVLGGEEEDENESDEEQDTTSTLMMPPRHLFLIKTLLSHPLSMKREKILEVNIVTPSGLHHHTSNNTSEEENSISEQNTSTVASSSTSSSSSTMIMINHETQSSTQNQYGIEIVWNPRKFAHKNNNEQNTSSDNLNNNCMIVPQLSSLVKRCFELLPFDEQSETIPLNFFVDQRQQQQNQNQNDDDDDEDDDDDDDEFLQNMKKNRQDELNREPSLASTMIDPPSTIPADGDEDDSSSEDDDEENDNPSSPSPDRKSKTTGTTTKTSSSSAASSSSKTTTAANNSIIFDEVLQDETVHIFKRFPNLRGMALVELCGFPLPGKKFSQMIFGSSQQHTNNTSNNDNSNNNQEFISNPYSNYSNLESFWDTTGTHSKERRREIRKRRKQLLRSQQQQENASTSITTEDFHRDLDSACSPLRLQISQQVKLFSSSVDSFSLRATIEQFLIHCSKFKTSSSSNSHQTTTRRNKDEDDERLDIVSYVNSSIFPPPPPNKKNNSNKNANEPSSPTSSSLLLMNREQGQAVLMKTSHTLDDEKEENSSSSSSSEDDDFFESSSSSSSSSFASSSTFSSSDEDDEHEAEEDSPDQQFYAHLLRHCGIAETLKQFETFTNPKFLPFTPCVENLNQFVRGLCFSSTTSSYQQKSSSSFYIAEILLVGLLKSIPLAEAFSLIELCIQSITTFSIQNEHCLSQQQQQTSSSSSAPASSSSTTNDDDKNENNINAKKNKIKSSSLETISPQDSVSQQGSQTTILRQEEPENNSSSDTSETMDEEEKEKVPKPSSSDDSTTSVSNNQNPTSNPSSSSSASVAASSSASSVYLGFFTRCLRHSPTNIENFRSEFFFETGLMQIFPLLSSYALLIKTLLISLQNSEEITQKHLLAEEERKRNLQQHQIPPPYQQQQQSSKKKNKKIIINQKQQNKSKSLQKLETLRQNLISDDVKLQALQFADTVLALLPDWTSTCLQLLENTNSAINRKEFNLKYLASLGCMDAAFVPRLLAEKSHVFGPLLSCTCLLSCEIPQHLYNKNNQNKNSNTQNKNLPLCSDRTAQDILNTVDQLSIRIDEEFIRTIGRSFKLARDTIGVRLLLSSSSSPEDESSSSDEEKDDESKTSSSSSSVWPLFCRRAELVKKIFGTRVSFAALQLLSEDGNESLNPLLKLRMFSKFTSGVLKDSSSFL